MLMIYKPIFFSPWASLNAHKHETVADLPLYPPGPLISCLEAIMSLYSLTGFGESRVLVGDWGALSGIILMQLLTESN